MADCAALTVSVLRWAEVDARVSSAASRFARHCLGETCQQEMSGRYDDLMTDLMTSGSSSSSAVVAY